VIAQAYLNEWSSRAPWPQQVQIEQDLLLSRLIVEIAQHELLGGELTFRGGTCLHKLHLPKQLRYSEDLVRHEAPYDRAGMKGLRRGPVAAGP
jgi:predicted nucleotidyltransferase component of viral defense system